MQIKLVQMFQNCAIFVTSTFLKTKTLIINPMFVMDAMAYHKELQI